MLPSIGTTFNYTFNGFFDTSPVSGIYTIQPVTDENMQTIIGYRNWQSYTGGLNAIFYGVSYKNSSYPQALIDPDTHECTNIFSETMNCTSWLNTEIVRWDSQCSLVRIDTPITGEISMTLRASNSDLKRPADFIATASISGVPDKTTITYQFLTKTIQQNFPDIKCPF